MIVRLLLSISLLFLASCLQSVSKGNGTGTDAGEAKIVGTALVFDSLPAANANVILREQNYIPLSKPAQEHKAVKTDSDGLFEIGNISSGYYLIELWNRDSLSAIKRFYISNDNANIDLGNITLDTSVEFTGSVLQDGFPPSAAQLLVMGLDKVVDLAADGAFSLLLPKGEQLFRIAVGNEPTAGEFLFSEADRGDTLLISNVPFTLLEGFDNMDGRNDLGRFLGGGWWFSYSDQAGGGNSRVLPTEETGLVAAIDTTAEAYSGGSLHIQYEVDSLFSAPYALVATNISYGIYDTLADGKMWFDLSNMTAVSFMAKGTGTVYLQLTSKIDSLAGGSQFPFEVPFDLTPTWKMFTISSNDIPDAQVSGSPQPITWETGATSVGNMTFLANKNAEIWIDNIILEGMGPADFLK